MVLSNLFIFSWINNYSSSNSTLIYGIVCLDQIKKLFNCHEISELTVPVLKPCISKIRTATPKKTIGSWNVLSIMFNCLFLGI